MSFEEILKHNGVENISGKKVCRTAVRAVTFDASKILMIHSRNMGDYKFPGGGVKENEKHIDALIREVKEESGFIVGNVGELIGRITEYYKPHEAGYDVFEMTSFYYRVELTNDEVPQELETYEAELGFVPVWIDLDKALICNETILSDRMDYSDWVPRETLVLRNLIGSCHCPPMPCA